MSGIFTFGEYELDAARFELRRAGERVDVQPKVLRLLFHLVTNRDRSVGADELMRELWAESTVGPGSIKRAVLGARQALGDSADSQSSIRTVRGHGYQFVREVRVLETTTPPTAGPTSASHVASPPSAAPEAPLLRVVPPPAAVTSVVSDAFLGRDGAMALLEASLNDALRGTSRCVLLTGGPGLGKTRAAEELWTRARELGAQTWLGRCTDVEGVPAFWPFIQLLRDALRDRGAAEMRRLMGPEGADIAQAMSELRHLLPDLPATAPLETPSSRFRLFDSIAVFLRRAAEQNPIVLGFDDLHLADPATLQLLAFVVRQIGRAPILIVGTFRRERVVDGATTTASDELPLLLEALTREDPTRCIELQGLSKTELARYVELATGLHAPSFVIESLHEQTAGNPLFVRQVVESWRAMAERDGPPEWQALVRIPDSQGLRGAIDRHLEVVPDACRSLLRMAAVFGREFNAGLLARVAEQPVGRVCARLAEAEATGLVQELPGNVGRYRFTHALIADALYTQLSAAESARLHGSAARAIEAQGIGESYVLLAEVTRHFVHAAPAHDGGLALYYTLRAAETALARLAYEEAAAHFECALQLVQYHEPDRKQRMTLLFGKGNALSRTSEIAAARGALFEAIALARELGDAELLYKAAALVASRPEPGSVDGPQISALLAASAALPEHDDRRVLLQALHAKSLVYASHTAERVQLARDALRRGRELSDVRLRTEVLRRCHEALPGPEHLQDRVATAGELLHLAHQQGDAGALLRALAAQIETYVELGDIDGVETALATMEGSAEHVREPFFRWQSKMVRSMLALVRGDAVLAERDANEAFHYGTPISHELARHLYCVQVVGLYVMQGRALEAEPLMREMALRYPGISGWAAGVGAIDWMLGRIDQSRAALTRIMERGTDWIRSEPFGLSGYASVAGLCGMVQDPIAAKALYSALEPFGSHHGVTHLGASTYGPMTRFLAILAECQGEVELAERHYRDALISSRNLRSPTFVCVTSGSYALLLLRNGRPDQRARAVELLTSALKLADASGFRAVAEYVRFIAKRHDIRTEERELAALHATLRERSGT